MLALRLCARALMQSTFWRLSDSCGRAEYWLGPPVYDSIQASGRWMVRAAAFG